MVLRILLIFSLLFVNPIAAQDEEDYLAPFEELAEEEEVEPTLVEPPQELTPNEQALFNRSTFENNFESKNTALEILYRDKFKIGYDTANWNYEEFKDGSTFMKDSGQLHGVRASYENLLANDASFWNLNIRYLGGNTLYQGGDQSGRRFDLDSTNSITEFSSLFGHNFALTDFTYFRPSIGISYRILSNPKNDYPGSYSREAEYLTVPFNIELAMLATDSFSISLGTNYHFLLNAHTESKLSETPLNYADIDNQQNSGKGYGAFINFSWYNPGWSVHLRPYYRIWDFEDSDPVFQTFQETFQTITYQFTEPENKTQELGASLSVGF